MAEVNPDRKPILEWGKDQAAGWSALVVYAITAVAATTTVTSGMPASHLRLS